MDLLNVFVQQHLHYQNQSQMSVCWIALRSHSTDVSGTMPSQHTVHLTRLSNVWL